MEADKAKEVSNPTAPTGGSINRPEKMSYEQLENIAHQLSEQNRQLHKELANKQEVSFFKRLDYLFKIIENPEAFSPVFYTKCVKEIEALMTIPENIPENAPIEKTDTTKD